MGDKPLPGTDLSINDLMSLIGIGAAVIGVLGMYIFQKKDDSYDHFARVFICGVALIVVSFFVSYPENLKAVVARIATAVVGLIVTTIGVIRMKQK